MISFAPAHARDPISTGYDPDYASEQTEAPDAELAGDKDVGPGARWRLSGDLRLRHQFIDRDPEFSDAEALTLRGQARIEVDFGPELVLLGEVEAVTAFVDSFDDGTRSRPSFAVIPDPDVFLLNRLQASTEIIDRTRVTLGRQRIAVDDWRFIGDFPFRQNDQTLDALRVESRAVGPGRLDAGVFNRANRPLGPDNPAGTFRGTSAYAHYSVETLAGRLSAYHYDLDLDTEVSDNSSRTTGLRLFGRRHSGELGVLWEAAYARQKSVRGNPIIYSSDYWQAGVSVEPGPWSLRARFEQLGPHLQTPLAALHRFQGVADQFLVTPPNGVRDLSLAVHYTFGDVGPLEGVQAFARYHDFDSAGGDLTYGSEWDFGLSADVGEATLTLEYGDYDASGFSTDTRTLATTLSFAFGQ